MKSLFENLQAAYEQSKNPAYNSFFKQLFDMSIVFLACRIGPGYFLLAKMGKKEYDWKYKLGFLNGRQYIKRANTINNTKHYPFTFNKLVEKSLLMQYSTPTPKMLGHLHISDGKTCAGSELKTSHDLTVFLAECPVDKLCFKLISDFAGKGFRAIEIVEKTHGVTIRDLHDNRLYSAGDYYEILGISQFGDFIIEEYFEQHPTMSALNPTSVNTLRLAVYQPKGQNTRCMTARVRIGRLGSLVDNGGAGGIGAKVNQKTGILCSATYSAKYESYKNHPDSGAQIEGISIPFFGECVELAKSTLQIFPEINYGIFDIAIGPNGPYIIELNARGDYLDFAKANVPSKVALHS